MGPVQWCASVVTVCLLLHAAAFAQVTRADLVGRVTDSTGAVLPGATVTIEHGGTGDVRTMPSNESGDYVFNLLPIGRYSVRIELPGFGTQNANVTLATGDRARVDVRLQLGQVTETISVTAESLLVQMDSATVGSLINMKEVQDLPVNGRNFVRLVQSLPGAHEGLPNSLASGTRPDDRRQTSAISINGALDNQNNQMIDGIDNNERAIGTIGVKPSIDAIAEIKVQTNLYTAEAGRTAGGVVNIITKSGTNEFSGSVFEFVRNDRFDSRNFFSASKPLLRQHQFGGSLGGPLRTNRTFFFADYEGFRHTSGVVNVATVPTAAMRRGDFSELPVAIYDPTTSPRTPFPGNQLPVGRLDPIALRYLALYPQPTEPGLANNFRGVRERTQNSATADVRIDHRINGDNSFFARYSWNDVDTFTPGALPVANGIEPGGNNGQFPGPNVTKAHGFQANYQRIFSPTLISEMKVGYLKADIQSLPLNFGSYLSREFGLPNVNIDDRTSALSPMNITSFTALGDANFIPLIQIDDTVQVSGSLTQTRGAHNIKVGGGVIARQFTVFQSANAVGTFNMDTRLTDNGAGAGGNGLAAFLLGYPSQVARAHSLVYPYYHTNEPHVYVQDDWRATSWLTLNLGVRYDVFTPLTEEDHQMSNFDEAAARVLVAGRDGVSASAGVKTDYSNVAPRLGFAATLPSEVVVRGGYGLAYFPGNYMSQSFMKNMPFSSVYGPILSAGTTGGIPNLRLSDGLPLPVATNELNPSGSIIGVAQDFESTRVHQFNVIVEKQLGGSVAAAGYVGSRGDNVAFVVGDINLAPIGAGAVQPRRTYAPRLPNVTSIGMFRSDFESFYNAMQLVFQRRYRDGLSFSTNYTLAHNVWTQAAPWDIGRIERFDADNDVRHRWTGTVNYELPFGRALTGVGRHVLGGWQVNAVASWQSGLPFNITNQTARTNTGGNDRPNLVGDPGIETPTIARWFNTAAFAAQPINTIGDQVVARNPLHGPSQKRVDLSLFKELALMGAARLQLRVEVYNVTNTPSFGNPNGALGNAAFGTLNNTVGTPRQMQFAAKLLF